MMFGQKRNIHRIFKPLAKAMIRLRECPGWSGAVLVAHTTLLEISCHGSTVNNIVLSLVTVNLLVWIWALTFTSSWKMCGCHRVMQRRPRYKWKVSKVVTWQTCWIRNARDGPVLWLRWKRFFQGKNAASLKLPIIITKITPIITPHYHTTISNPVSTLIITPHHHTHYHSTLQHPIISSHYNTPLSHPIITPIITPHYHTTLSHRIIKSYYHTHNHTTL